MNKKDIGIIGLGRMGGNIALHLQDRGYQVLGFDISEENRLKLNNSGIRVYPSFLQLCGALRPPRIIMIFVPAGKPVDDAIDALMPHLEKNDILLDCGNSFYKDSIERERKLNQMDVHFMDVGTSGGVSGARNGPCLTIGGNKEVFLNMESIFRDLAVDKGYLYVGPSGWGHLVKVIHNGIEYGMLQAIAEGLGVIKKMADQEKILLELDKICEVWSNGSIIESRLMSDAVTAMRILSKNEGKIEGKIGGGETGLWAMQIAETCDAPSPVLQAALEFRRGSQYQPGYIGKIISVIRKVFGEHELSTKD